MTDREQRYLENLARRATSVAKFANIALESKTYIPTVMSLVCGNLQRTMLALLGKDLRDNFFEFLEKTLDEKAGICFSCDNLITNFDHGMCEECWKRCEEEDREAEKLEKMELDYGGGKLQ